MPYELIKVTELHNGQVAEIRLSRPPANIVSAAMMKEISAALDAAQHDPHKKLIILAGEGKHFSFGASVEEHKPEQVSKMLPQFHVFIGKIINSDVPTLAKVSGLCLGGGFEVAMACTFLFAGDKAKFAVPEIQLGVFPPVASALLPLKVGDVMSSQIILSGEQWSAGDLHKHGLINAVTETEALDQAVENFIKGSLLKKSARALRLGHRAARMVLADTYAQYIGRLEALYLQDLMATKDAVEGITSFLEKREPQWVDA